MLCLSRRQGVGAPSRGTSRRCDGARAPDADEAEIVADRVRVVLTLVVVAEVGVADGDDARLRGRAGHEGGGGQVVVPVAEHDDGVLAADERGVAVGGDGEHLAAGRLAEAAGDDARGPARTGVDPREAVGGGAERGADLGGIAAELPPRTDEDEGAADLAGPRAAPHEGDASVAGGLSVELGVGSPADPGEDIRRPRRLAVDHPHGADDAVGDDEAGDDVLVGGAGRGDGRREHRRIERGAGAGRAAGRAGGRAGGPGRGGAGRFARSRRWRLGPAGTAARQSEGHERQRAQAMAHPGQRYHARGPAES